MSIKKVLIVSRLVADHVLAQQFNHDLEMMLAKREALVEYLRKECSILLASVPKQYKYEVKSCCSEPFLPPAVREQGAFRVLRVWINKEEYVKLAKTYGVSCDTDKPESVCSLPYYKLNNVLVAWVGAGAPLLVANQEISDLEWQMMQRGIVPDKFLAAA